MFTAADLAADETGGLEDGDVTGYSGEAHRQRRGQIGDAGVAVTQRFEESPSCWVGQRGVRAIEKIFNHLVDYSDG